MSTVDPRSRCVRRRRTAGFTFIEMSVALGILSLMALVIERTLSTTHNAERYLSAIRRSTERGQKISYEVFDSVSASRKLFQRDQAGIDYLASLDTSRDAIEPNARLPLFDDTETMAPDIVGDPRTGNVLLFVRESDPAPCVADAAGPKIRFVDTYRFICVFPSRSTRRLVSDEPELALDLVIWRSVPYPSYAQLMAIEDVAERASVVRDLHDRYGHDFCWDPNAVVSAAFYKMDFTGTIANAPDPNALVEEDLDASSRGRLVYANVQLAKTVTNSYHRRAVFTTDDPLVWRPDGFEVKMAGASGSRKVWLHLVVECQAARGRVAVHENTMIASTRDL